LNSDVQVIQDVLGSSASILVRAMISILVIVVVLLVISPTLTGMVIATIIPYAGFTHFY